VTSDSTDTSVVVIGGGQAGLSVSYYLKRLGLDPGNEFVVLDRGPGTGGAWQFRWDALRIGSAHRINDLPGMDEIGISFSTADRTLPAKDVVADYYAQYEEHYGFQIVRSAAVSRVENAGDRMLVTFSGDEGDEVVSTDIVINATGTWGSPFIPWYPGRDSFAGRHVHTAEYRDAAEFAGQKVVVVGGGTSAIGFLLELESVAASTTWVSRRPIEFLEDGELNLEARVEAVAAQDEAARAGRALPSIVSGTGVPRTRRIQAGIDRGLLSARPMFSSIEPGGVRWSNGSFQEADAIIWSTGFRPELRHLAPLKLREREGGIIVAGGSSWKEPRIFFAGYGPQASTIGANRAGRSIARQAVATLSRLKRVEREERDALEEQQRLEERMRQNAVDSEAARASAFVAAAEAERAAAVAQIPALVEPPERYAPPAFAAAAPPAAAPAEPVEAGKGSDSDSDSVSVSVEASVESSAPAEAPESDRAEDSAHDTEGGDQPAADAGETPEVPLDAPASDDSPDLAPADSAEAPASVSDTVAIDLPEPATGWPFAEPVEAPASDGSAADDSGTHLPWIAPSDIPHDSSTATVWPLATGYPVPAPSVETGADLTAAGAPEPDFVPEAAFVPEPDFAPEPDLDPEAQGAELTPVDTEILAHLPELGSEATVIDDPDSLSMAELLEHINAPEGIAMPESSGVPDYAQSPEWEVGAAAPEPQSAEPSAPPEPVSAASHVIEAPHWFTEDHSPSFFDDEPSPADVPSADDHVPAHSGAERPAVEPDVPHFRSSFSPPEVDFAPFPGTLPAPQVDEQPTPAVEAEVPHFRSSFSPPEADFPSFFGTLAVPPAPDTTADSSDADGDTNELTADPPRTPRH
jgi:cation diffusion facilitator CzcD-associated flavoprotein CzcO